MDNMNKIEKGYRKSKDIYDDAMTSDNFWFKLYNSIVWGMDDKDYVEDVLKYIPEKFSGHLLEVPVGTGIHTSDKYKTLKNAKISALDYSSDMLEKAGEKLGSLKNVRLIQGDVGNLPFEDASFDMVLSMNGFHAFPDKNAAFEETDRVLKENGVFCGCFYIKGQRKLTDFFVSTVYVKKGWFTPPFYSFWELEGVLKARYKKVELKRYKSIICFYCVK